MESLVVHIENKEQSKVIKAVLKALNVKFEKKEDTLPKHVLEAAIEGLRQIENGEGIAYEDFKKEFLTIE